MLYLELSSRAAVGEQAAHVEGDAAAVYLLDGGGVHGVLLDVVAWGGGDDTLPGGSDDSHTHVEEDSAGY